MNRILAHMLCLLMPISMAGAQDRVVDSLLALTGQQSGSALGKTYYILSLEMVAENPDTALYYANQAELILTREDPENLLPALYVSKAEIYAGKMVTDRSLFYYSKAYDGYIIQENDQEAGDCALHMGNIYYELGDFSEAYYYYMQSLNAFERENDQLGIARMENNLGIVAHEMGNLDQAENHYFNAYEIYRERDLITDASRSLNNLGLIHYDMQEYDTALIFFQEALDNLHADSTGSEAQQYILSGIYNNVALAHTDLGEYQSALDYLRLGLQLARQINDQYNIGSVYINLGSLFGKMDYQDSALFYLHRALRIAETRGFKHMEMETYNELAQLHARQGNYASAYNWQSRYDTVYKEIFNEEQSEQIANLRARYEQELKDREIEQLQSESQVQKMLNKVFIIFIVVTVALVIVIAVNLRSKKRTNQMLAERNMQISNALQKLSESEKELQKLNKSKDRIFSVVAHDLRNPVAAVTGFSELLYDNFEEFETGTQKEYLMQILQGTQRIQNLLDNLLIWARSQMQAIKYEPVNLMVKEVVENCVKELKANFDHKKIDCVVNVDRKGVVFADKGMLHTVMRNLVMNAVKFSFPGSKIRITSNIHDNFCHIAVSDDGIGIQPEIQERLFNANEVVSTLGTTGESGSGLGLVICKEFMERNQGTISVQSEPGNGSTFVVSLPLASVQ